MTGKRKPTPREAFNANMKDAELLVKLARALENRRKRRVRAELRERVGIALRIQKRDWPDIECVESNDLFVVFKPTGETRPDDVSDLRPLLRQALVAGCAAAETFVADRVEKKLGGTLMSGDKPSRLLNLPLTVEDWFKINRYQRRLRGLSEHLKEHVRREVASASPSQIGIAFSLVGQKDLWKLVDRTRGVKRGSSEAALDRLYARRNRIAHQGDRVGRGRSNITVNEVESDLLCLVEIVDALDQVTR